MQIRDRVKELRRVRAGDVRPNPKNWRKHPKAQQDALRGVLAEVGYADALLAREMPDGSLMLVDGHLRAETTPDMMVPVLVLDVNEAEADKILATLDPLAAMADTDGAKLDALLREVDTGSEALQEMLAGLADDAGLYQTPEVTPGAGGDEFDAKPEEGPTRAKAGDLWVIGGVHRLLVGDCTVKENVERLMGGAKADLVLTDPPYGIDYGRAGGFSASHGWGQWRENVEWDKERPPKIAFDMLLLAAETVVVWGGNYFTDYLPPSMRWLIWDKGQRDFSLADCEMAWTSQRKAARVFTYSRAKALQDGKEHPTQKPVALMQWCIETVGEPKTIYDPFLGSGTTLIAAHRLGRKAYGCELEPKYADVVLKRAEAEGLDVRKEG